MFHHSVVSYPNRGSYGNNKYRGNCTGHIIKDFVESYLPSNGLFVDPSVGGGTSQDVATELGINFAGLDLHSGFNLLCDDLPARLKRPADAVFWHPPYWNMIQYSGKQWGEASKWDMSRLDDLNEFGEALELALMNIHDAVKKGGHYGILMGNLRRKGRYYNLSALVERLAPGRLVDEIIKVQHNCVSDNRQYSGKLVRIAHEKLLVFKQDNGSSIVLLSKAIRRADNTTKMTWRAAIRRVVQSGTRHLSEIYAQIEPYAATRDNNNWQAKVRQVLQDERYFSRIERGQYALAA